MKITYGYGGTTLAGFFPVTFLTLLAKCRLAKEWRGAERWELDEGDKKTTYKRNKNWRAAFRAVRMSHI